MGTIHRFLRIASMGGGLILGCSDASQGGGDRSEEFGLRLPAHDGAPAVDVGVRVVPHVPSNVLAEPSAQLVLDAMRECNQLARAQRAFDSPVVITLVINQGRVQASAESEGTDSLTVCLRDAMSRDFSLFGNGRHDMLLQIVRAEK